jgi:hypothetical protein
MRTATISTAHSSHNPKQTLKVDLQGGSPYFGYIWIDDKCYSLRQGPRTYKLVRVR